MWFYVLYSLYPQIFLSLSVIMNELVCMLSLLLFFVVFYIVFMSVFLARGEHGWCANTAKFHTDGQYPYNFWSFYCQVRSHIICQCVRVWVWVCVCVCLSMCLHMLVWICVYHISFLHTSFGWNYKLRSSVCIHMQKDHIHALKILRPMSEHLILKWALSASQRQLYNSILCFRADSLCSSRMQLWMSHCTFPQQVFDYPQKWLQCSVVVTWLVPRETAAVSAHVSVYTVQPRTSYVMSLYSKPRNYVGCVCA